MKNQFLHRDSGKISFLRFHRKLRVLGYMLLHNSYINVVIANILLYRMSLYDLQKPKYKNHRGAQKEKWAWPIFGGPPMELGLKLFFGDTRPPVAQLDTGIRLLTPMSRSTCFLAIFAWISMAAMKSKL